MINYIKSLFEWKTITLWTAVLFGVILLIDNIFAVWNFSPYEMLMCIVLQLICILLYSKLAS